MRIFFHLGKRDPDYRFLMRNQQDFWLDGQFIPIQKLVIAEQTHSRLVNICTQSDAGAGIGIKPQIAIADGIVTNIPNLFLLIRTADCTPIILMDSTNWVVCAVHSGREGTRKNIAGEAVRQMKERFDCNPRNIEAIIGAGICHNHYQVSPEIFEEYNNSLLSYGLNPATDLPDYINIRKGINEQLIQAGIPFRNIENIMDCTYENEAYHSFRREGSKNRQINIVGIIDE